MKSWKHNAPASPVTDPSYGRARSWVSGIPYTPPFPSLPPPTHASRLLPPTRSSPKAKPQTLQLQRGGEGLGGGGAGGGVGEKGVIGQKSAPQARVRTRGTHRFLQSMRDMILWRQRAESRSHLTRTFPCILAVSIRLFSFILPPPSSRSATERVELGQFAFGALLSAVPSRHSQPASPAGSQVGGPTPQRRLLIKARKN